jgi:hypothetical protein
MTTATTSTITKSAGDPSQPPRSSNPRPTQHSREESGLGGRHAIPLGLAYLGEIHLQSGCANPRCHASVATITTSSSGTWGGRRNEWAFGEEVLGNLGLEAPAVHGVAGGGGVNRALEVTLLAARVFPRRRRAVVRALSVAQSRPRCRRRRPSRASRPRPGRLESAARLADATAVLGGDVAFEARVEDATAAARGAV